MNMKTLSFPAVLAAGLLAVSHPLFAADSAPLKIAPGPFKGENASLKQYQCPDWFRDAKFGMWSHWGPQAVPMAGDWYAKNMYVQGSGQNKYHVEHYGPPSKFGYKDIIPLWKAEKWDPDRLMALYKNAGAKYFVSMGSHHDNFFLWNSQIHKWNSVNMGPRRDVVGDWQKAAKKQGLRFGVSEHLAASFTWFQTSHGADKTGPQAGMPYDGADPQYQDLYHFAAEANDKGWNSNNPKWQQMWFDRVRELVDNYDLDLLYSDSGVPFGNEVGRSLIAHLYNNDLAKRGKQEVIYNCKQNSDGMWVQDVERGVMPGINPYPWQTDTSIGDWYYNRNWKFRPTSWLVHMLVDIVSKNGNLLVNVVQRPDGSLDPEAEQILEQMAGWIKINGEAIYGTRPWLKYGEGPIKAKGGNFKEDFAFSAQDIRFTTKNGQLYAFALGWPENGKLLIRTLAGVGATNRIQSIRLLGATEGLTWSQDTNGLTVNLPAVKPCDFAVAMQIAGQNLAPVLTPEIVAAILPGRDGALNLAADLAVTEGAVKVETSGNQANLGFWDDAKDTAQWRKVTLKPGAYEVEVQTATVHNQAEFVVELAGQSLPTVAPNTGDWTKYQTVKAGRFQIQTAGEYVLTVKARSAQSWKAINLRHVKLAPAGA
jgi:alpha-L-fucosidase